MKTVFKFLSFALIAGLLFSSCEKDTFTEEDAMKALQEVNLMISVTDQSNFNQPIEAATVSIVIDSVTVAKTTNATGMVCFEKVKISGNLNVYISKTDYTSAFTTINTRPADYRQTTVSRSIGIYSLSDENLTTVKGQLTIETDLTNRTKEVVAGAEVRVSNYSLPDGCAKNFIGTTDSIGKYEIKVPVNSYGNDDIKIHFNSVETTRTVGIDKNHVYTVETQEAFYDIDNNFNPTNIDAVPSAVITIGAPEALGTGFDLTTEIVPSRLTDATGNYWNMHILKKGIGYFPDITDTDTAIWVPFSPGTENSDDTAFVYLRFEKNGGLIDIVGMRDYSEENYNDAFYSANPTINLNLGGGSGADIYYNFKLYYNVKISNNGTGYFSFPTVKKTYFIDGIKYVNDYDLSSYTAIVDGSIYGDDILSTEGRYDTDPTFEIFAEDGNQAEAYFLPGDINTDSTFYDSNSWISTGNNYNPAIPPTINITTLAGYGSGAEFRAEVSADGSINNLELIRKGTGYVRNINDYNSEGTTWDVGGESSNLGTTYFYDVLPGNTIVKDIYYGTGYVTELE